MWNPPTDEELQTLPRIGANEDVPWQDVVIHHHYFIFSSDWFVAECGVDDRIFYGYAILNNDLDNAEWGYMSLDEMREVRVRGFEIDRDLHWSPRRAGEV